MLIAQARVPHALVGLCLLSLPVQTLLAQAPATAPVASPAAAPVAAPAAVPAAAPAAPAAPATAPVPAAPAAAAPAVAPVPPAADTARLTVPERHAQKRGFTTCAAAVGALSQSVVKGSRSHQALTTASEQQPDKHALHSMIVAEGEGSTEVFSMYVAPTASGGCDAGYSSVRYYESSCAGARETVAADFKYLNDLGSYPTYAKNNSEYLTLIPLPKGCLAIRSETIY